MGNKEAYDSPRKTAIGLCALDLQEFKLSTILRFPLVTHHSRRLMEEVASFPEPSFVITKYDRPCSLTGMFFSRNLISKKSR